MANDTKMTEQILNLIDKSDTILLLTHAKADCDGLGSMISMYLTLKALGKKVVAATNDPTPDNLSFLPSMAIVQNSLKSVEDFIITLDVSRTPLKKIRYNLEEKENGEKSSKVNIIITPKMGRFNEKDVSFLRPEGEEASFDLIMTFDTGNLEHLGPLYDQNTELFFKTPLINIDHHASNTDFGQVNLVDMVAASTTEVMLDLLRQMEDHYDQSFINEDIATLLLAGLITDTGSFQHANTSPNAMEVAAELLDLGARQQEIIKNIYKSKQLSTLKLWGTILSKVQSDPIYRMVWSSISEDDLNESEANSDEAEGIIDDLLSNAPGAEIILLFKWNEEGYVAVSMRSTTNSADVGKIATDMGGGGHVRAAGFKVRDGKTLEEVVQQTLKKVKEYQGQRLNIHPDTVHQPMEEAVAKSLKTSSKKQKSAAQSSKDAPTKVQYLDFDSLDAKDERDPKPQTKADLPAVEKKDPESTEKDITKKEVDDMSEKADDEKKKEPDFEASPKESPLKEKEDQVHLPRPAAVAPEKKEEEKGLPKKAPETKTDLASTSTPSPALKDAKNETTTPPKAPVPDWLNPVKKEAVTGPAAEPTLASAPLPDVVSSPKTMPSQPASGSSPFIAAANVSSTSPAAQVTPTPMTSPTPQSVVPTPQVSPPSSTLNPNAGTVQTNQNVTPSIHHPSINQPAPQANQTPPAVNPLPTPPQNPSGSSAVQSTPSHPAPVPPSVTPSPVPPPNPAV